MNNQQQKERVIHGSRTKEAEPCPPDFHGTILSVASRAVRSFCHAVVVSLYSQDEFQQKTSLLDMT